MTPERHERIGELLDAVLDLEPTARRGLLDQECADDPSLRAEIESLLDIEADLTEDFLATPAALQVAPELARSDPEGDAAEPTTMPDTIGPYRLVRQLGRGGMGTVYLAEQQQPVERRVALKVINGFDGEEDSERLAMECRALARLQHPHVATVYDGGVSAEGHAFVAMEWIDGTHITRWCDQRRLSIEQRIELFLGVCAGVAHAHQKGILHQDLKPSNVLVTEVDGRAVAKVIDFGIAQTVDEPQSEGSGSDWIVGSPIYMSPESAAVGELDVDTRSDVFSLGVLLYRLLVGTTPIDVDGLAFREVLRRVRHGSAAPTPSRRWLDLDPTLRQPIAEARRLGEHALARRLRGDLDAIVSKATAHDRDARYDGPADLATDLRRHLQRRPVDARPRAFTYTLGRFVQRNIGSAIAIVALIAVLVGGIVARTQEARRANLEADRARLALAQSEKLSDFLIGLFETTDPDRPQDDPVSIDEVLAKAETTMDEELAEQPVARARFLQTIGRIAMTRHELDRAASLYEQALALRDEHQQPGHEEIIRAAGSLGVIYRRQGRLDDAEAMLTRAIDLYDHTDEPDLPHFAATLTWLANLHFSQQRYEEAVTGHRRALEIRRREDPPNHGALAESLNNLAAALRDQGRFVEAHPLLEEAEVHFATAFGPDHPLTVTTWFNLAGVEERLGNWQEAERQLLRAADAWTEIHGPTHSRTLLAQRALGGLWRRWHREEEAVDHLRAVLATQLEDGADDRLEIARTRFGLGLAFVLQGDLDAAETVVRRALEGYGTSRASIASTRALLARIAWKQGRLDDAASAVEELLAEERPLYGDVHPRIATRLWLLGQIRVDQDRWADADAALGEALAITEAVNDGPARTVADCLHQLGRLRVLQGRHDEAVPLLRRAVTIFEGLLPADHPDLTTARDTLATATSDTRSDQSSGDS